MLKLARSTNLVTIKHGLYVLHFAPDRFLQLFDFSLNLGEHG